MTTGECGSGSGDCDTDHHGMRWRPPRASAQYNRDMATTGVREFQNFIGGEWVDAASGETFESTSPADGETIGIFPKSGVEDVDRAVAAAKEAYQDWRLVPAPKRGEILFAFARLLVE